MADPTTARDEIDAALRTHDRAATVAVAQRLLGDGRLDVGGLYDLLTEILVGVGASWQAGQTEVWQEHLSTGIVRSVVEACTPAVEAAAPPHRTSTVLLAAPEDEYHELGLRMLADRFTLAGWRAHFLGANVPADELVAAVGELGAEAVAVSASTHLHRLGLRHYVSRVTAARPRVRVWVGGPAFAHDHGGWSADAVLDAHAIPPPGAA